VASKSVGWPASIAGLAGSSLWRKDDGAHVRSYLVRLQTGDYRIYRKTAATFPFCEKVEATTV